MLRANALTALSGRKSVELIKKAPRYFRSIHSRRRLSSDKFVHSSHDERTYDVVAKRFFVRR